MLKRKENVKSLAFAMGIVIYLTIKPNIFLINKVYKLHFT